MFDWNKILEQLAVVTGAPIPFAVAVLIVGGFVWFAVNWSYSSVLESKKSEIELLDRQVADYKEKLHGASPDEAKARIDALEARLAVIEPRRLTSEQRSSLVDALKLPWGTSYRIAIVSEASGDSAQYAADFSSVFHSVSGWTINEASALGLGNRPPNGLALIFPDLNNPPPEVRLVMVALNDAKIKFDVQAGRNPMGDFQLLICTKIVR